MNMDLGQVARELELPVERVQRTVELLDEGNTVPFITRYRKDQTGGLDEEQIRQIQDRSTRLRMLAERKQTILKSIQSQGKLTDELAAQIEEAHSTKRLEDLYLPFKPKKQTLATQARQRGLEPFARELLEARPAAADLEARAADFVSPDKQLNNVAEVLLGVGHLLAERYSERAELRHRLRKIMQRTGRLVSMRVAEPESGGGKSAGETRGAAKAATGQAEPTADSPKDAQATAEQALPAQPSNDASSASETAPAASPESEPTAQQAATAEDAGHSPLDGSQAEAATSSPSVPENEVPANEVPTSAVPENAVPENAVPENAVPANEEHHAPSSTTATAAAADDDADSTEPSDTNVSSGSPSAAVSPDAAPEGGPAADESRGSEKSDEEVSQPEQRRDQTSHMSAAEDESGEPPLRREPEETEAEPRAPQSRVVPEQNVPEQNLASEGDERTVPPAAAGKDPAVGPAPQAPQAEPSPAAAERGEGESSASSSSPSPDLSAAAAGEETPTKETPTGEATTGEAASKAAASAEAGKHEEAAGGEQTAEGAKKARAKKKKDKKKDKESAARKTKKRKKQKLEGAFKDYFDFQEPIAKVPPHRVLAINRGERAKILRVKVEAEVDEMLREAEQLLVPDDHPHADFLRGCVRDALLRLVIPSLEREVRRELTERAEEHAVEVFIRNLRKLLLQPPIRGRRVLAVDPGFRSGCKLVALDEFGNVIAHDVVHVVGNQQRRKQGRARLVELIQQHALRVVAIGNGTACRETEQLVAEVIGDELKEQDVAYVIVNEAGASVYSTSPLGREELPQYDPTIRSAISIGRRLFDPLSELVKINPANIGVGLYQHDVKAKHLRDSLDAVVESSVNFVGVDVNTASPALLRYVSGLNQLTARRLYDHRREHGPFRSREQFRDVPGFGDATFVQAAGFLKITGGDNPLDATWIHPESYDVARRVLEKLGSSVDELASRVQSQTPPPPPAAEKPAAEKPAAEKPAEKAPEATADSAPGSSRSAAEQPSGGEASSDASSEASSGASSDTQSAGPHERSAEAASEATETPSTDAPSTEAPSSDAPSTETPSSDAPSTETPSSESPGTDAPSGEAPGTDAASSGAAGVERADGGAASTGAGRSDAESGASSSQSRPLASTEPPAASLKLAESASEAAAAAKSLAQRAAQVDLRQLAEELGVGRLLLKDIISALTRPGRDPRDDLPPPVFRRGIMKLEDLQPGMELTGTVLNVVDFGAFVDIGLSDSGLVHISRLADRYVKDPHEVVSVGDTLRVWVVETDKQRRRVSLTAIEPGTEKPHAPRHEKSERRRGGKPGGPPPSGGAGARGGRSGGKRVRPPKYQAAARPARKPKPVKPITKEMEEGKEPLRSFSDLMQFYEKKREPDEGKGKK